MPAQPTHAVRASSIQSTACVREAAGGPEAVGRAILDEIRRFSRGHTPADDITLVCFGPTPGQSRRRLALGASVGSTEASDGRLARVGLIDLIGRTKAPCNRRRSQSWHYASTSRMTVHFPTTTCTRRRSPGPRRSCSVRRRWPGTPRADPGPRAGRNRPSGCCRGRVRSPPGESSTSAGSARS